MLMPVARRRPVGLCEPGRPDADCEAQAWKLEAAEFAQDVVGPLGVALDRLTGAQAVASTSPLHEFIALAHDERFTRLTDSAAIGGAGISVTTEYLVLEELAAADAGLTALLIGAPLPFRWAHAAGSVSLDERLGRPYLAGSAPAWSGCLVLPALRGFPRARSDARGWRLSGATDAPIIGAATATHAAIACVLDASVEPQALAILPLDRAGVQRRPAEDRVGLRAGAAAWLELSEVSVLCDELIRERGHHAKLTAVPLAVGQLSCAITCVGIARSAYEGAARWAAERGTPDATRLVAPMRSMLERARAVTRAAHRHTRRRLDAGQLVSPRRAEVARRLAAQTAAELAGQALQIAGPGGLDPEGVEYLDGSRFRPEKLVRDAYEHSVTRAGGAPVAPVRAVHPRSQRSAQWGL
jgi:alkylation response protein AidB-like acyl-CoA dehydrogenase